MKIWQNFLIIVILSVVLLTGNCLKIFETIENSVTSLLHVKCRIRPLLLKKIDLNLLYEETDAYLWMKGNAFENRKQIKLSELPNVFENDVNEKNVPFIVVLSGWGLLKGEPISGSAAEILKAVRTRRNSNTLYVATEPFLSGKYVRSAYKVGTIGMFIAKVLKDIVNLDPKQIHIIGFSIGAQLAGAVGREYFNLAKIRIGNITALDPARPCFQNNYKFETVGKGNADFVAVVHSNPGGLGIKEKTGDIDFLIEWPNNFLVCNFTPCKHTAAYESYAKVYSEMNNEDVLRSYHEWLQNVTI